MKITINKAFRLMTQMLLVLSIGFISNFANAASFTAQDVASHGTEADCWVIVNNKVYNLTSLITRPHTGGSAAIIAVCGKDGSGTFNAMHSSSASANAALTPLLLGDLTTVQAPVLTTVTITPTTSQIVEGSTQQLYASTLDQNSSAITATVVFSSSDIAIATVDNSGLVTGVALGSSTITATATSGSTVVSGTVNITVTAAAQIPVLTSVTLEPPTSSVSIGGTKQFTASPKDQSGAPYTGATTSFTSSNVAIATVDVATGLVTGISQGSTIINVASASGNYIVTGTANIEVTVQAPYLSLVTVGPANPSIVAGVTKQQLVVSTFDQNLAHIDSTLTFSSSNTAVATVDNSGLVTGVAIGTSTITATATSGSTVVSGTLDITVTAIDSAPINLLSADGFVILSKAGITNVPTSKITGNIGTSPIAGVSIAGLGCPEVTGIVYSVDATGLSCSVVNPTLLTNAISDMEGAFTNAEGRTAGVGPFLNVGGGTVAGQTLIPGVYTWGSNVSITTDLTLAGGANDVWIFQISGTLDLAANKNIILSGGAQAKNIFWQVADTVTLDAGSHFEGNILAKKNIAMKTGASLNGRALAQTEVALDQNTLTIPVTSVPVVVPNVTSYSSSGSFIQPIVLSNIIPVVSTFTPAVVNVLGEEFYRFTKFLRRGSRGNEVTELQKFLNKAGHNSGGTDGIFGAKTKAAVIKFQNENNLKGDGIVGALTRAILNK